MFITMYIFIINYQNTSNILNQSTIKMQQNKSGSSQDVKSQVQLLSQQPQHKDKSTISIITNKQTLLQSLYKSYLSISQQSTHKRIFNNVVNCVAYCLQAFWTEVIPDRIKGASSIKLEENTDPFFQNLKKNNNIVVEGSLLYALDCCRSRKQMFVIAIYKEQQDLYSLPSYIDRKIRNYIIIPIKNTKKHQLNLLSIRTKPQQKLSLHICQFNFAGELVIFSEVNSQILQTQFMNYFTLTQFSINQYKQFEETNVNRFKQGFKYNQQ